MSKVVLRGKYGDGKFAEIDDSDANIVSKYRWHLSKGGYVRAHPKMNEPFIYLHVLIMGKPSDGIEVDHKDRNQLNNRRCNLRYATRSQNQSNVIHPNLTGFRGVSHDKKKNVFRSFIRKNNIVKYLGTFKSAENAARAYDCAAKETFGEFAILNFS